MKRGPATPFHPFEEAVLGTARREGLFGPDARVLVAFSGGPDSTSLLACLASFASAGLLSAVSACHVDHGLRAGSAADGDACAVVCRSLGIGLARVRVEVGRSGNLQASARRARYHALREAARAAGANLVATGHTRGDQAETVLHRLLRGAGARGLAGIPPRRGDVVRPLLDRSRAEVVAYLRHRGLAWREDPTNASPRFLRNRLRAEVLPLLEALAPGLEARLACTASLLREDDRALEAAAAHVAREGVTSVAISELVAQPPAVRRRIVRRLWREVTGSRRGLDAEHVARTLSALSPGGAAPRGPVRVSLPRGFEAVAAYGRLELVEPQRGEGVVRDARAVPGPGRYEFPGKGVLELAGDPAALTGLPWPLELRTRRPGDRFSPEGGPGTKKLKAWLIDRKIARARREDLVLLAAAGRVLIVPELGARASGLAGVTWSWQPWARGQVPGSLDRAPHDVSCYKESTDGAPARSTKRADDSRDPGCSRADVRLSGKGF